MKAFPPIWNEITFLPENEDPWQNDRFRKCQRIRIESENIERIFRKLAAEKALTRSSPEILKKYPEAGEWYVALAGYAQKTLKNSGKRATEAGLTVHPETFVRNLKISSDNVTTSDLTAFSKWINAELNDVFKTPLGSEIQYAIHVAMIWGGKIIGQGQNEGGGMAVEILKKALFDEVGLTKGWFFLDSDNKEESCERNIVIALKASMWIYRGKEKIEFDFRAGGNRPDIKISAKGKVLLVGEIKGRKDLSNTWESWMPQLADHLITWKSEFPTAHKGVFMTVITEEMVTGKSRMGTKRTGLKELHQKGMLDFIFNLTAICGKTDKQIKQLKEMFEELIR